MDGEVVATAGIADAGPASRGSRTCRPRAAHRRRGLAGALDRRRRAIRAAAQRFGSARFVLVAEREGPAIGLYRRLGFREVETQLQLTRLDAPAGPDA